MKQSILLNALAAGLLAVLFGCGSGPPTMADVMRDRAAGEQAQVDQMNQLAEDWERGASLMQSGERRVRDGEQLVQRAERDLERGREQIQQGRREISEGERLRAESERKFRERFPEAEFPGAALR